MSIIIKSGSGSSTATVNSDGSLKTASTIASSTGAVAGFRPDGMLRVANDPTSLFFDNFETFNVIDSWAVVGGTAPTFSLGQLTFNPGTAAGAGTLIRTIPAFPSQSNSYVQAGAVLSLDAAAVTGNKRFWGLGIPATTPSATIPLQSGVVFEISDADGALYGAVYANGVRTKQLNMTRPTDGGMHRYIMYYRTSKVYFEIDGVAVGSIDSPNPNVSSMPFVAGSVNLSTTLAAAPTLNVTVIGVADASRNNMQLSDGTFPFRKAQVGRSGGLSVKGAAFAPTSLTLAAGATGIVGPVDVSEAGNLTVTLKNSAAGTAYTGAPMLVFEQSDDGVSWGPLVVVRNDTNNATSTHVMAGGTANGAVQFDAPMEGINYARVRVPTGTTTGGITVVAQPGGLPFSPAVTLTTPARTNVLISGTGLAVGATGTENMLTLIQQKSLLPANTATSFTVPLGKKFRLQSLLLSQVGNLTTATVATTIFRMRFNPTGAATTASTLMMQTRLATPAQTGAYQQIILPIPDGFELPGDGVGMFGISAQSTYTTYAPTVDVQICGYEY